MFIGHDYNISIKTKSEGDYCTVQTNGSLVNLFRIFSIFSIHMQSLKCKMCTKGVAVT